MIVYFYFIAFLAFVRAFEWPAITFKHKNQCTTNETYDIQLLNCEICSSNLAVPSKSGMYGEYAF